MLFRARELGIETRLVRMEDPLPDGPWDLVIAVLSVGELDDEGKRDLLRRVREQSRSLVLADTDAAELAESAYGEVTWSEGDLAVVAAAY